MMRRKELAPGVSTGLSAAVAILLTASLSACQGIYDLPLPDH